MMENRILDWLQANDFGAIEKRVSLGAGNSSVLRLYTSSHRTVILKHYSQKAVNAAASEAKGLLAMAKTKTLRIPTPYDWTDSYLLLEDIERGSAPRDFAASFGHLLAQMHETTHATFGFEMDNYIGANPQKNTWETDGYTFFAEQRLRPQFEWARKKGFFTDDDKQRFEVIVSDLQSLIPVQPASLLHGDLWSGNVLADEHGKPTLIDPATYFGWGEADLAMTVMFGGFGDAFFAAYQEIRPLVSGWRERLSLYNLYHYLNHLNLFGGSYLSGVRSILRKFS